MKSALIVGLQVTVMLFGLLVLVFLICEPQVEGRNAHATQFEIYFQDLFLAYVYLASVPFLWGLYQVEKLLTLFRRGAAVSPEGHARVRNIQRCAFIVIAAAVTSLLFMINDDTEDGPPGLALRLMVILPSIAVALLATKYERRLRDDVEGSPESRYRP